MSARKRVTVPSLVAAVALTACAAPGGRVDVTEWRRLGAPVWAFERGVIAAGPGEQSGYLVSTDLFSDFQLRLEFRIDDATNSGVFVRCLVPGEAADVNPDTCYEVNIWDNHPIQDFRTGSIVKHVVPAARVDTLERWNELVVRADGPTVTVVVNGVVTAVLTDAGRSSGVLALQYAGRNRLAFRDLRLSRLR